MSPTPPSHLTPMSLRLHLLHGHPFALEVTGGTRMQRPMSLEMGARGSKVLGRRVNLTDAVCIVTNHAGDGIHHVLGDAGVAAQRGPHGHSWYRLPICLIGPSRQH